MTHSLTVCTLVLGLCAGCTPLVRTPERFLALDPPGTDYDYRATTADGVVLGARVLEFDEKLGGGLAFWVDAIKLRVESMGGYALLAEKDFKTDAGLSGKQLRFGHDERQQPFQYWLTLFVAGDELIVVEAGGPEAKLKAHEPRIEAGIRSVSP